MGRGLEGQGEVEVVQLEEAAGVELPRVRREDVAVLAEDEEGADLLLPLQVPAPFTPRGSGKRPGGARRG